MITFEEVKNAEFTRTVVFPLTVPSFDEVFVNSEGLDLSKYALNACYSKPLVDQKTGQPQSWFDVTLTINDQEGLPPRKEWFYIVTDDEFIFKARFSGKKIKKLSTFENKKIIGLWIKGRLIQSDLVFEFEFVDQDRFRQGVITKEMLQEYGGDKVFLKKTDKTLKDGKGNTRDVWYISFPFTKNPNS